MPASTPALSFPITCTSRSSNKIHCWTNIFYLTAKFVLLDNAVPNFLGINASAKARGQQECSAQLPIQTVGFPGRWGKSMHQHDRYLCANFCSDLGPPGSMPEFERLGCRRFEWRSQKNHRVHVCVQHNLVFLPGEISKLQAPFNTCISII